MPLEDDFSDIIKKARNGLGLSVDELAEAAKIEPREVGSLERGQRTPTVGEVESIARVLSLHPKPLVDIAQGHWMPAISPAFVAQGEVGVETVMGDVGGYAVKGYIVYDDAAKEAVFVDTAYNAEAMLHALMRRNLRLKAVCLTHGHTDHSDGLEDILAYESAPVFLGRQDEGLLAWHPSRRHLNDPAEGQTIHVGRLTIRCLQTPGHTPGGICYRVEGLSGPVCFVGDTLFAGSIGRSNPFGLYRQHLQSVHQTVLRLPESTVLLPGHGPATTVTEELVHNPFAEAS